MTHLDPRDPPTQSLHAYVAARQLDDRLAIASIKRAARRGTSSSKRPPRMRPQFRLRAA